MYFGTTHYLQNVVAWGVAEVPHANLCAHVPATEGAASELQAANLQQHVGDRWEAIPLQVQVLEPLIPGESKQGVLAAAVSTDSFIMLPTAVINNIEHSQYAQSLIVIICECVWAQIFIPETNMIKKECSQNQH